MEQAAGLSQASCFNGLTDNKAECSVSNTARDLALTITAYSYARYLHQPIYLCSLHLQAVVVIFVIFVLCLYAFDVATPEVSVKHRSFSISRCEWTLETLFWCPLFTLVLLLM